MQSTSVEEIKYKQENNHQLTSKQTYALKRATNYNHRHRLIFYEDQTRCSKPTKQQIIRDSYFARECFQDWYPRFGNLDLSLPYLYKIHVLRTDKFKFVCVAENTLASAQQTCSASITYDIDFPCKYKLQIPSYDVNSNKRKRTAVEITSANRRNLVYYEWSTLLQSVHVMVNAVMNFNCCTSHDYWLHGQIFDTDPHVCRALVTRHYHSYTMSTSQEQLLNSLFMPWLIVLPLGDLIVTPRYVHSLHLITLHERELLRKHIKCIENQRMKQQHKNHNFIFNKEKFVCGEAVAYVHGNLINAYFSHICIKTHSFAEADKVGQFFANLIDDNQTHIWLHDDTTISSIDRFVRFFESKQFSHKIVHAYAPNRRNSNFVQLLGKMKACVTPIVFIYVDSHTHIENDIMNATSTLHYEIVRCAVSITNYDFFSDCNRATIFKFPFKLNHYYSHYKLHPSYGLKTPLFTYHRIRKNNRYRSLLNTNRYSNLNEVQEVAPLVQLSYNKLKSNFQPPNFFCLHKFTSLSTLCVDCVKTHLNKFITI